MMIIPVVGCFFNALFGVFGKYGQLSIGCEGRRSEASTTPITAGLPFLIVKDGSSFDGIVGHAKDAAQFVNGENGGGRSGRRRCDFCIAFIFFMGKEMRLRHHVAAVDRRRELMIHFVMVVFWNSESKKLTLGYCE